MLAEAPVARQCCAKRSLVTLVLDENLLEAELIGLD